MRLVVRAMEIIESIGFDVTRVRASRLSMPSQATVNISSSLAQRRGGAGVALVQQGGQMPGVAQPLRRFRVGERLDQLGIHPRPDRRPAYALQCANSPGKLPAVELRQRRHARTEYPGRRFVRSRHPCRVVPQRRRAVAVAEPASDRPQVDPGRKQLGRRVVPQLLEQGVDAQLRNEPPVPARERRRVARPAQVRPARRTATSGRSPSSPSRARRAEQSSRYWRSSSTVGASIDTRRIWWVLVSLSSIPSAVRT